MQIKKILVIIFLTVLALSVSAQDSIPVHNIENRAVQRYTNEVTYDYYSEDFVGDYIENKTVEFERCAPFVIALPHPMDTIAYLYYNIKDEKVDSIRVNEGETEVKLNNLYPGKDYEYSITVGEDTIAGEFKTVGRVRMIAFPTMYNCRDLGGWRIGEGKMIRYGMLYRGMEMHCGKNNTADSAAVAGMKALGIAAELDMRRTYYLDQYSDLEPNETPKESVFGSDVPYTFLNLPGTETMLTSYRAKFSDGLKFIIDNIRHDRPVYFHCVWGADRTGLMASIIESILGVSLEDIYKEYDLTAFSTKSGSRDKSTVNVRLLDKIYYNPEGEMTLQECCTNFVVSQLGIPMADIEMLREKLIVDDDLPVVEYVPDAPDVPTEVKEFKSENLKVKSSDYYNLVGQRTVSKKKGIIIHNGKKIIKT